MSWLMAAIYDGMMRGSEQASWRFRIPCELCNREMVVTWDGGLVISRVTPGQTARGPRRAAQTILKR